MSSKRSRQWLVNVCMLLLPLGATKVAAFWFSAPPSPSRASAVSAVAIPAASPVAASAPLTPAQLRRRAEAAEYVQKTQLEPFGPTPFYYVPAAPVRVESAPAPVIEQPGVPSFTVQVIMASETDTKALIDGKVYRVGDEFRGGWIIAEIDSFARTVTIADPATSRTITQAVRMPGR